MVNPPVQDHSRRFSLRRLLLLLTVVAMISAGARFVYVHYHRAFAGYEAFGAIWQTHDMLIHYMNNNDGDWPSRWDDLRASFAYTNQGYGAPDVNWLEQRVTVDFSFDPSGFTSADTTRGKPFYVLLLPGGNSNGDTQEANRRIKTFVLSYHVK